MKVWLLAAAGVAACVAGAIADEKKGEGDAWTSLVAAERAFSADSEAHGIRASFLAAFEPGVLTFPPGKPMQVGTTHLANGPEQTGVLTWRPVKAEVSAAGDFGYTTGPYEVRRKKGDADPAGTGSYASVWRRRPGGVWKVIADFGCSGPHPADADTEPVRPAPRRAIKKPGPTAGEVLIAEDHRFEKASAANAASGYDRYVADDIRCYRDGRAPALGREETLKTVGALKGTLSWFPERARVADGGDLGYTVGTMTSTPKNTAPEHMKYLRIWRREGGKWKVVLEVANAAPAPAE